MWSYYGNKSKIVNYYPAPIEDKIIEPFAGTARYALKYWEKDVLLVDAYEVIIKIWQYLQRASIKDIEQLPELKKGEKIPDYLCEEEKMLMGFAVNPGSQQPKLTCSPWAGRDNEVGRHKRRIIKNLYKIKHWTVQLGTYKDIENQKATWFIDPPYQNGGNLYIKKDIDYGHLGTWVREREMVML